MASKSGTKPRKKNQQDTKERLLKAALDIFSKDGYSAATTRNIAKKAGVNESLIQRYFDGKRGLFYALTHQFRDNIVNQFLTYDTSKTLEEEFVRFMTSRLETTAREKKFFKMALSEAIHDTKSRDDIRNYANTIPAALEQRFEHFRNQGQIRQDIDLRQMLKILQSFSFSVSILTNALECMSEEDTQKMIALASSLLTQGLKPKGSAPP